MRWSHRSVYLIHRFVPVLIFAVVALIVNGTSAVSAETQISPRATTLERGEGAGLAHDPEEGTEFVADFSGRQPATESPRPRAKARFPERALSLPEVRAIMTAHGPGSGTSRPATLAAGDFDGDGVADLICGYAKAEGGLVTFHSGNVDSIFPHSPGARLRRQQGPFSEEAFLSPTRTIEVPVSPDYLAAGDFDGDDLWDVVVADSVRPTLYLLSGNGSGGFAPAVRVALPAPVTALASGEINRADGLPDLAVGVGGEAGAALLVFEGPLGAMRSEPEVLALDTAPGDLFLGRFYGGPWNDVAVAVGSDLMLLQGRDRRLVLDERQRATVGPPVVERIEMPSAIEAVAWGDFAWEPFETREMAVLLDDGTLRLLSRNENAEWKAVGRREVASSAAGGSAVGSARSALVPVHLSGLPTTDLALLNGPDQRLQLLAGMVRRDVASSSGTDRLANAGTLVSLETAALPTAVLPMRLNPDALSDLVLLLPGVDGPVVAATAPLATITVNTNADSLTAGDGDCSLREAIINSNTDSDTTSGDCAAGSGADTIGFNIAGGGGPAAIAPLSTFPAITDAVTIDGTTQGCTFPPCVALDGSGAGFVPAGLSIEAGPSTIRGLAVHSFLGDGVTGTLGLGIFITSSGNIVEGNYIGTDITGTLDKGNLAAGVRIEDGSNNTIGGTVISARNLISGADDSNGINLSQIAGTVDGNDILGNFIGTDVSGTVAIANAFHGVRLNLSTNTTIGGTTVGARNLISGNDSRGILLISATSSNLVLGNYVGTDVTGALDLGNLNAGIQIQNSPDNIVGGTTAAGRNVIAGNDVSGMFLTAAAAKGNLILGNHIGVDATGTVAVGNVRDGILMANDASNNTVGGSVPGARNVISGNGQSGVELRETSQNTVLGNFIGTDATGTVDLGNTEPGIWIRGSDNTIGGTSAGARNIISGNPSDGIFISGTGATGNEVLGNYIGTDVTGTADLGNLFAGAEIDGGSNNTIGGTADGAGNLISGNDQMGVLIEQGATQNSVLGNLIGTDVTGAVDLGNTGIGVWIADTADNTIGGTADGAGNLISGNGQDGIVIELASDNQVAGNLIGTDVSGTVALGNDRAGVRVLDASDNTIGGTSPGARNVISNNVNDGVIIVGADSLDNQVLGNFIGTDVTGTVGLGNGGNGVAVELSSNTIGGTTPGARNIISDNGFGGIALFNNATGVSILGNYIGTQVDGTSPLGNTQHGIYVADGSNNNTIGGTGVTPGRCDGPCNRIGFSVTTNFDGVRIQAGSGNGNAILGNSIFSCAELGIDLEDSGVTPNDPMDPDAGANNQQNFPVLTVADGTPAGLTVTGTLNSKPGRQYRLEFFGNSSCDSSGHGEGVRYLGFQNVTTDGSGDAIFSVPSLAGVSNGDAVTATATSTVFALLRDTSEFSQCVEATCLPLATLGQTVFAPDPSSLAWTSPDDVLFVKGPLAGVGSYTVSGTGNLPAATSLDISSDDPGVGAGFYYLVRPLACGSWQTALGDEPDRDAALP